MSDLQDKFYSPAHDGGGAPLPSLDDFYSTVVRPDAFAGGTSGERGEEGGTNDPFTLFHVTGDVLVKVIGVCTVDLVGNSATLEVGVVGNTAALIAQTTATDIDANDSWIDASPAVGIEDIANINSFVITNGMDIIESVGTADITAGNIYYICLWRPLTEGSKVEAAV